MAAKKAKKANGKPTTTTTKPATTAAKAAAPGKPATAAKPASAATAKKSGAYVPEAKITWIVKENPRTKGFDTYKRFEKYFGAKTVADYLAKGGTMADLRADIDRKYLSVR